MRHSSPKRCSASIWSFASQLFILLNCQNSPRSTRSLITLIKFSPRRTKSNFAVPLSLPQKAIWGIHQRNLWAAIKKFNPKSLFRRHFSSLNRLATCLLFTFPSRARRIPCGERFLRLFIQTQFRSSICWISSWAGTMARDISTYNLFIAPLMLPREDSAHDKWRLLSLNIKLKFMSRPTHSALASGKFLIDLLQASIIFLLLVFVFVPAGETREELNDWRVKSFAMNAKGNFVFKELRGWEELHMLVNYVKGLGRKIS